MIPSRLKSFLLDNYLIKIVSLIFAVALWLYVNSSGGVEMDLTVPLELRNMPTSLVVVGDTMDNVDVRVKGRERLLRAMTTSRIRAVLDLSNGRAGSNVYLLDPTAITVPPQVQITRISPRRIPIRLELRAAQNPEGR
ncbi:MAG: hypothetical protein HY204_09735 [Nitrospirae bacterium]|nr:hypothetical protein [Nitrospirota bacterium]